MQRMIPSLALALAVVWTLVGCASASRTEPNQLPASVRDELTRQQLPASALAFKAYPLGARNDGFDWQADVPMRTGSTMKAVTAIVALDRLGPNWRGRTDLLAAGALSDGVLDGALVLRGGADADLDWGGLWQLLRQAREAGIRDVRGGLVIDRSLFQPEREDRVPPFDEAPEFPYNVIPDALHLNGNLLELHLSADATQAQARWFPAWAGLQVDASGLQLVDAPCAQWEDHWQLPLVEANATGWVVKLRGAFPRNCRQVQGLNLFDRDEVAKTALLQVWRELGGVAAAASTGATPAGARVVASHRARPLAEVLRSTMKSSDNALTRLVYLRLGAQQAGATDTRAAAQAQVRAWIAQRQLDGSSLVLENGSGLSRSERLSPTLLAQILEAASKEPYAPELMSSLPLAGVDGTMSRRLKDTPAQARARLKTGTLRDTVGLAGFVQDARNRTWVVAALVNHEADASRGRAVVDALMAHIASLP
jgi:D-alanyl-D-alanine carboxypeptidase/D-alanyl-D-alanine-endopeptidase (penicillin-binding protein 4)